MSVPAQSRSRSSSPPGRKPHAHWCTEAHRTPSCNTAQPASDTNDVRRLTKDNMRLVKLNEQKGNIHNFAILLIFCTQLNGMDTI